MHSPVTGEIGSSNLLKCAIFGFMVKWKTRGDLKSSPYWVVGSSPTRATKFSADSNVKRESLID